TRSAGTQTFPFSGLWVRCRASTLHLAEPPRPEAVVPGGGIDLTREGFFYALNLGILSFSVMAQSLVNQPYGDTVISVLGGWPTVGYDPAITTAHGNRPAISSLARNSQLLKYSGLRNQRSSYNVFI